MKDYVTPFLEWLFQSDYIKNNKFFLNAVNAENDNIQCVTQQVAKADDVEYIDGSVLHKVTFTIFDFKNISYNQVVKQAVGSNENIEDLLDVNKIIDYVENQNKERIFPNFGSNFEVQSIYTAYSTASTPSIDTGLAKYSIPVICEVMEYENT